MSFSNSKKNIRNFCIIAHIDHGKSTLADRILELTNAVDARDMENQLLDNMELERERGITIKARAVSLSYKGSDDNEYIFDLIDTPGHVDFNYEVSRALAACEGAILLVDASQGIEAQTLANTYLALDAGLEIIPVINKVDLPGADIQRVKNQIQEIIGLDASEAPLISAKLGTNVSDVLNAVIEFIPPPNANDRLPLRALIFDSVYDSYKGVIIYVRIMDGCVSVGDNIKMMATGASYEVVECGFLKADGFEPANTLYSGFVGYITASIKSLSDAKVGDTVTLSTNPAKEALPGYREVNPMVFCGIYPADGNKYQDLKQALGKLYLNDASLSFVPETSVALGFGFRCGFLGLLHLEIITQRLEREFNLGLITTAPSVIYKVIKTDGSCIFVHNPSDFPAPSLIKAAFEPIADAHIFSPSDYIGNIMELCQERRGIFKELNYIEQNRVDIHYLLPLNEIIYDFFDVLKSKTRGYASFDYVILDYQQSDLVKLDILLNGELIDAFSFIVHQDKAYSRARAITQKLKINIPKHLFEIPIQACISGKIIARETVKAQRKDVLAKCYGGDISRKKKLLEKQKEGKKKLRKLGSVELPSDVFLSVLKLDDQT